MPNRYHSVLLIAVLISAASGAASDAVPTPTARPFMDTPRLVATCRAGSRNGDAGARSTCETYLMGIFDAALAIQTETRREHGDSAFMVLCNPETRPSMERLIEDIVQKADIEPGALDVGPAVYVIRTLNPPFSCK